MNKYEITKRIENFAPPETQEPWDCSGWVVDVPNHNEISKIMLCLTVTDDVVKQARENNCDMIISHHPLFFAPFKYAPSPLEGEGLGEGYNINIYCAHTNLDIAKGGTTDCLLKSLHLNDYVIASESEAIQPFLKYINTEITIKDLILKLKTISPNLRYVNNQNIQTLHKIAFCAGSGAEFIEEAYKNGADALVTGDIKFHTAIESPIVLFDIGHFESEIGVLKVFENLINNDVEVVYAREKSPFNY